MSDVGVVFKVLLIPSDMCPVLFPGYRQYRATVNRLTTPSSGRPDTGQQYNITYYVRVEAVAFLYSVPRKQKTETRAFGTGTVVVKHLSLN